MTLHSSLFFKSPLNYEPGRVLEYGTQNLIAEMTNNDYRTFSTLADVNINMADASGNPTPITHIFIKAKNLDTYALTPLGGSGIGFTGRQIPTSVLNYEKRVSRTTVSGFQHDLYALPSQVTATAARLQFTGTNVQIHAVMLLSLGWEIDANRRYREIQFNKVDRTGSLTENPTGRTRRNPPFNGTRFKWDGRYTCTFRDDESVPEFMQWVEENPNCAFAIEFTRYPARVFPAAFPSLRMPNGYLGKVKSQGEYVQFRIAER